MRRKYWIATVSKYSGRDWAKKSYSTPYRFWTKEKATAKAKLLALMNPTLVYEVINTAKAEIVCRVKNDV